MQDARTHNIDDAFWVATGTRVLGVNGEFAHVSEGLVSRRRDGSKATRIWKIQGPLLSSHVNVDHAIWGRKRQERGGTVKTQPSANSHTRPRAHTYNMHAHGRPRFRIPTVYIGMEQNPTGGETEAWRQ